METISIKAKKSGVAPKYFENFSDEYGYGRLTNETRYAIRNDGVLIMGQQGMDLFKQLHPVFDKVTLKVTNPWLFTPGSNIPTPNPDYLPTNAADNAAAIAGYVQFMRDNFVLIMNYRFPVIPDTPGWTWWKKVGTAYSLQIPVEVGKYGARTKWVETIDETDKTLMGIVNLTMLDPDRDRALRYIFGI